MVPHVEPHWFHLVLHRIRYKLGKWFHILEPISIFWGKWFHIHKWNHYGSTWFPIVLCMFGDNGSTFFSKFGKWFHIGRSTVVPQHLSNFLHVTRTPRQAARLKVCQYQCTKILTGRQPAQVATSSRPTLHTLEAHPDPCPCWSWPLLTGLTMSLLSLPWWWWWWWWWWWYTGPVPGSE